MLRPHLDMKKAPLPLLLAAILLAGCGSESTPGDAASKSAADALAANGNDVSKLTPEQKAALEKASKTYPGGGGASFFLAFEAELTGGTLAAADDALDARFFGPDELPELAFDSTRDAVKRLT